MKKTFNGVDNYKKSMSMVVRFIEDNYLELTYLEIRKLDSCYIAYIEYNLGLR